MPNISVIDTPVAAPSVTNKPAVQGSSLYHTCRSVLDKLSAVEGMVDFLTEAEQIQQSSLASSEPSTSSGSDPLSKLWTLCRRGSPLCTLFNVLQPEKPLKVDRNPSLNQLNACKASVYHFIVACRDQLNFAEDDLFTITDLYQNDTNGFVKVVNTVDKILNLLEKDGLITVRSSNRNSDPDAPKDTRDKVVLELLATERKYVQDLEVLQNYMRELQTSKILSPVTIHYLFGNLNSLVDFQRRFLIQLENAAENAPEEQRFCLLFIQQEDAFAVYEPYCANYFSAQDLVQQEAPKLEKLSQILEPKYELPSMLIKPVQRICKYPLLLGQLIKTTNKDWPHQEEMQEGLEAIKRVAEKVNETQRKHENLQAVESLRNRIDEADRDIVEGHGNILLQGQLTMSRNDNDREFLVYLFEKVLLICKETKDSSKNRLAKSNTLIKKKRRASLQPKGKIYTNRIFNVINKSHPGNWMLAVEYKDKEIERFVLKFRNEEQLKLWESTFEKVKSFHKSHVPNTHLLSMGAAPMTPVHSGEGLYLDDDDDEDEDDDDDEEDDFFIARSRSNSVTPQQMMNMRPKMSRNNSQDASSFLVSSNGRYQPGTPGMNLAPLSRVNGHHPITPPLDYSGFPVSPPPSGPSSPGTPSRISTSTSSTSSTWHRRGDDNNSTLIDIGSKFMSATDSIAPPSDEYIGRGMLGTSPARSLSHSVASHPPLYPTQQPPPISQPKNQTRVRSQSSPNIHKNLNGHIHSSQWEDMPQMPINSRTLYNNHTSSAIRNNSVAAGVSNAPTFGRLSEATQPLQSQVDRVASAVPNPQGDVKIKLNYNDGIYVTFASEEITFLELMEKVEKKIKVVGTIKPTDTLRLKYQDEDGDLITINSDDDVLMAFENRSAALNLFVSV
ncbi:hypothetical protein BX666DRAFT_2018116 [Dichotomocladium elegans]|nr:hypothetical protein BX666DRAFT_2018116 [Dichotomocladium elegans]